MGFLAVGIELANLILRLSVLIPFSYILKRIIVFESIPVYGSKLIQAAHRIFNHVLQSINVLLSFCLNLLYFSAIELGSLLSTFVVQTVLVFFEYNLIGVNNLSEVRRGVLDVLRHLH